MADDKQPNDTSVREVTGEGLTTWSVSADGGRVRLGFEDASGQRCRLDLPFESVNALLVTIPRMLNAALRAQGDRSARLVQPLGNWRLEQTVGSECLILTLSTPTGFDVAFKVAPAQVEAMSEAMAESSGSPVLLN